MKLDEKDVRSLVRLLSEVVALRGSHFETKRFLMEGLGRLVNADAWVWGLGCSSAASEPQIYVSIAKEGFTEASFVKFLEAVEHPEMISVTSKFFDEMVRSKTHLTRLKQQIVDEAAFRRTGAGAAWQACDIGPLIFSVRPLDGQAFSSIGFYRRYDRQPFTARESRMVHIMLNEVSWLHEQGWPEDRGVTVPKLSRRQRLALNLLTLGQGHKQIAANMNISLHTTKEYIKSIYRYFGVSSQAELMKRFFQGNGRDME